MKTIKEWAPEDRPRERLLANGAETLSKAELLAILIGSGVPGKSAVDIMRTMLSDYGDSLMNLSKASVKDLMRYDGIGKLTSRDNRNSPRLAYSRITHQVLNGSFAQIHQTVAIIGKHRSHNIDSRLAWHTASNQDGKQLGFAQRISSICKEPFARSVFWSPVFYCLHS